MTTDDEALVPIWWTADDALDLAQTLVGLDGEGVDVRNTEITPRPDGLIDYVFHAPRWKALVHGWIDRDDEPLTLED